MSSLLNLSRLIDRLNEFVGRWVSWLVLAAVLISAINASVRKAFDTSSNAFLEIQWYLFAAVFLLASGYTMLRQEHVKIDVILGRFSRRTQIKVEIFGLACFLLPLVLTLSRPDLRTLSVGIYSLQNQFYSDWGLMTAGAAIALVPIIVLFVFLQRYFVESFSGAIKG